MKDTGPVSPMLAFKRRYGDMKCVGSRRDKESGVKPCQIDIGSKLWEELCRP